MKYIDTTMEIALTKADVEAMVLAHLNKNFNCVAGDMLFMNGMTVHKHAKYLLRVQISQGRIEKSEIPVEAVAGSS